MHGVLWIALWIIGGVGALAVYLNIGWALGFYIEEICGFPAESISLTFWEKFWRGPDNFFNSKDEALSTWVMQFVWPIMLLLVSVAWLIYGIYALLWFVFAGGIAKSLGWA